MTISPQGVLPCGGACRIEECVLCGDHEWLLCEASEPRFALGGPDLLKAASNVIRRRTRHLGTSPRNWLGKGPVDLERPFAVSEVAQYARVHTRKTVPCDRKNLPWRKIEQHHPRVAFRKIAHAVIRFDLATKRTQITGNRIADFLRSAFREWPSTNVRRRGQSEHDSCRRGLFEWKQRVARESSKQGTGPLRVKAGFHQRGRRAKCVQARCRQCERITQRASNSAFDYVRQHLHWSVQQAYVRITVSAKVVSSLLERVLQEHCRTIIQRMRQRHLRMNPL